MRAETQTITINYTHSTSSGAYMRSVCTVLWFGTALLKSFQVADCSMPGVYNRVINNNECICRKNFYSGKCVPLNNCFWLVQCGYKVTIMFADAQSHRWLPIVFGKLHGANMHHITFASPTIRDTLNSSVSQPNCAMPSSWLLLLSDYCDHFVTHFKLKRNWKKSPSSITTDSIRRSGAKSTWNCMMARWRIMCIEFRQPVSTNNEFVWMVCWHLVVKLPILCGQFQAALEFHTHGSETQTIVLFLSVH